LLNELLAMICGVVFFQVHLFRNVLAGVRASDQPSPQRI
jgi:hypothetical protein